ARRRWPARTGTAGAVPTAAPAAVDSLDDAEALAIEVRHLAARVAVSDEYIGLLLREAARRGVRDVVRARFAGRVMQVRQRLRRLGATRRSHRGSG
ncbi:MAG: hypothetical protein ACRENL_08850, partial [Candidatus Dormibacteria bacterium]